MADSTGSLLKERKERETAERNAKEEEKIREATKEYVWEVREDDEKKMIELLGQEALEKLKTLWQEGPSGWKIHYHEESKNTDANQHTEAQVEQNDVKNMSGGLGGSRGGRGNRGGQGGGRAGGDNRKDVDPRFVVSKALASKEERTATHQLIRETFKGRLTTDTLEEVGSEDSNIKVSKVRIRWMSKDPSRMRYDHREAPKMDEHPPYIHFLLQKTNRESQDAMNLVARSLGLLRPGVGGSKALRDLSVAGTKDKRAVTVQKVAFRRGRRDIDDVWKLLNGVGKPAEAVGRGGRGGGQRGSRFGNAGGRQKSALDAIRSRGDRGIRVGHLEYAHEPLHLGMQQGNEFVIVLRDVQIGQRSTMDETINVLKEKGFINYYGMQRFGTSIISTHTVGLALLLNDFHKAVGLIMAPRPGDVEEAQEARKAYAQGDLEKFLKLMPNYNIAERSIVQRMLADKQGRNDWKGYFMAIPRGLRTMYVHAYQSYIWNRMVTERVKRFGLDKPVIGDLVFIDNTGEDEKKEDVVDSSQDLEVVEEDDQQDKQVHGGTFQQKKVKELENEEDVEQYSIHDIVMPLPGNEIQLSEKGWMAAVYKEMLAEDKMTPEDIGNSTVPEFALTGDYRKVLHLPRNVSYQLFRYRNANANLCQSDEDEILGIDAPNAKILYEGEEVEEGEYIAMLLRLTLGASAYATMALREVLKQDTSVAHQKELTERSDRSKNRNRSPAYRNEAVNKIQGKQIRTWGAPRGGEEELNEIEVKEPLVD